MARTALEQEFIEDHQILTSGFQQVIDAVEMNDPKRMRASAESLDKSAGPHMQFEEQVLYPQVGQNRGDGFEQSLLREHQVARSAILFLTDHDDSPLAAADRARVLEQLRIGLDHAISCGALLSHVTVASEERQQEMLGELREFRRKGTRWTELGATRSA